MEQIRELSKIYSQKLNQNQSVPHFFSLVRAYEKAHKESPRIGFAKSPKQENVRFGQKPSLHFQGHDIAEIVPHGDNLPQGVDALILSNFFGLLGVNGPMPLEFTNYVFQRSYSHYDNTWRRFLDIIHHRFHTFYYRAYAGYQQSISFDRPDDDPIRMIVKSLTGVPCQNEPQNKAYLDQSFDIAVGYARQFAFALKTCTGLQEMLSDMFCLPVEVEDCKQGVFDIPKDFHAFLGKKQSVLGVDLQIGRTFLSLTQSFDIKLGPISYNEYCNFYERGLGLLNNAVHLFLDRPLHYNIVFVLESKTIPGTIMGGVAKNDIPAAKLGINCWLGREKNQYTEQRICG